MFLEASVKTSTITCSPCSVICSLSNYYWILVYHLGTLLQIIQQKGMAHHSSISWKLQVHFINQKASLITHKNLISFWTLSSTCIFLSFLLDRNLILYPSWWITWLVATYSNKSSIFGRGYQFLMVFLLCMVFNVHYPTSIIVFHPDVWWTTWNVFNLMTPYSNNCYKFFFISSTSMMEFPYRPMFGRIDSSNK